MPIFPSFFQQDEPPQVPTPPKNIAPPSTTPAVARNVPISFPRYDEAKQKAASTITNTAASNIPKSELPTKTTHQPDAATATAPVPSAGAEGRNEFPAVASGSSISTPSATNKTTNSNAAPTASIGSAGSTGKAPGGTTGAVAEPRVKSPSPSISNVSNKKDTTISPTTTSVTTNLDSSSSSAASSSSSWFTPKNIAIASVAIVGVAALARFLFLCRKNSMSTGKKKDFDNKEQTDEEKLLLEAEQLQLRKVTKLSLLSTVLKKNANLRPETLVMLRHTINFDPARLADSLRCGCNAFDAYGIAVHTGAIRLAEAALKEEAYRHLVGSGSYSSSVGSSKDDNHCLGDEGGLFYDTPNNIGTPSSRGEASSPPLDAVLMMKRQSSSSPNSGSMFGTSSACSGDDSEVINDRRFHSSLAATIQKLIATSASSTGTTAAASIHPGIRVLTVLLESGISKLLQKQHEALTMGEKKIVDASGSQQELESLLFKYSVQGVSYAPCAATLQQNTVTVAVATALNTPVSFTSSSSLATGAPIVLYPPQRLLLYSLSKILTDDEYCPVLPAAQQRAIAQLCSWVFQYYRLGEKLLNNSKPNTTVAGSTSGRSASGPFTRYDWSEAFDVNADSPINLLQACCQGVTALECHWMKVYPSSAYTSPVSTAAATPTSDGTNVSNPVTTPSSNINSANKLSMLRRWKLCEDLLTTLLRVLLSMDSTIQVEAEHIRWCCQSISETPYPVAGPLRRLELLLPHVRGGPFALEVGTGRHSLHYLLGPFIQHQQQQMHHAASSSSVGSNNSCDHTLLSTPKKKSNTTTTVAATTTTASAWNGYQSKISAVFPTSGMQQQQQLHHAVVSAVQLLLQYCCGDGNCCLCRSAAPKYRTQQLEKAKTKKTIADEFTEVNLAAVVAAEEAHRPAAVTEEDSLAIIHTPPKCQGKAGPALPQQQQRRKEQQEAEKDAVNQGDEDAAPTQCKDWIGADLGSTNTCRERVVAWADTTTGMSPFVMAHSVKSKELRQKLEAVMSSTEFELV